MERQHIPRPHANLEEVVKKAMNGDAFFVNRAALNGDLAQLPQTMQRRIVAVANDEAARYALEQIIATTDEQYELNNEFIEKHSGLAVRIFFSASNEKLEKQIEDFYV